MEASTATTSLSSIAENTCFVLGAYFFAFFSWAVMHNIDFISEKWRTIRQTREHAYVHIISSVVSCFCVAVYAEAQRQNKDSKELGAAMAALMFNVIQLLRTLMGKVQVETFVEWCKHAQECLRALQGGHEGSDVNDAGVVENNLRVNSTVVDNDLGGTEATVLPSCRKMWKGLKRDELSPRKRLEADWAELCTVRWCAAYLCGVEEDWSVFHESRKRLELFFSDEMEDARGLLRSVTWNGIEENDNCEIISVKWLGNDFNYVDISGETTIAYGSRINELELYNMCTTETVEYYSFEVDSLVSSYPAVGGALIGSNRERVPASLAHSVILAKHLRVEKLRGIRRYYKQYQTPKRGVLGKALRMYLEQTDWNTSDESEIFDRLCDGGSRSIPLFPYRMQLVALWEQETNWRVLQASAHADVSKCLLDIETDLTPLHQLDTKPSNVFDYCSNIARNEFTEETDPGCTGVVLESVRSLLGEWQMKTTQEVEWEPAVSLECFDFHTPLNILNGCSDIFGLRERMIWVCQEALQREVVRISNEDGNLPSNRALITLFLLRLPDLLMDAVDDSEVEAYDSYTDRVGGKVKYERKIRRADLRDGMVTMRPLRTNDDEIVVETSSVEVWMGCPPFDVQICKFEVEQWLKACDIDLAAYRLVSEEELDNWVRLHQVDKEIWRAERVIETVVSGRVEEVRDEIEEKREGLC